MSFKDLVHYLRARSAVEEGQTMAEYGVVLAVITLAVIVSFLGIIFIYLLISLLGGNVETRPGRAFVASACTKRSKT